MYAFNLIIIRFYRTAQPVINHYRKLNMERSTYFQKGDYPTVRVLLDIFFNEFSQIDG